MKTLLVVVVFIMFMVVCIMIGTADAGQIDWGGSFTFKLAANPENVLFDHKVPEEFADMSADIEAQIDERNLLHTSIKGVSGSDDGVTIGDSYLKTDWGFMTTKMGTTDYESMGYAVTSKEYELKKRNIDGPGISVEIPINKLTIGAGKSLEPCEFGFGAVYETDIFKVGLNYVGDVQDNDADIYTKTVNALAGGAKLTLGNFSAGGGIRVDDRVWAHGMGAKYSFAPSWIAWGYGYEAGDIKYSVDTGLEYDKCGSKLDVSYFKEIDEVNLSAWYKPNVVKLKIGYDWKVAEDNEVYAEISADF